MELSNRKDEQRENDLAKQEHFFQENKNKMNTTYESTLQIRIHSLGLEANTLYHNVDSCIDYIMKNGLVILKLETNPGYIHISAESSPTLRIKKICSEDYDIAINLIEKYSNEFRPKIKWKGRNISQLVHGGLEKSKWVPYGYYDNNVLIGYIDYKISTNGLIELGTLLIDEKYRDLGLGASLINLCRLKFFSTCLYSGTYEENTSMISTFKKTGFHEYNIDAGTNKRRERINPDDPNKLTNSVYFITNPLLKQQI